MPLPEGYLPREGDELLIRCRVSYDVKLTGESVHVSVVGADHHRPIVPMKSVHGLYCRHWKEGERVIDEDDTPGTVISTKDEFVWVYRDALGENEPADMFTYRANELRPEPTVSAPEAPPVEPPPPAPAPAPAAVSDDDDLPF